MRSQRLASTCFKLARASGSANFSTEYPGDDVSEAPEGTELPPTGMRYPGERLTADWESPKMTERHTAMFNKLDKDGNGMITLDEILYKASVEICENIGATPEQTENHTECVTKFFGPGGLGLEMGVETSVEDFCKKWEALTYDELDRWAAKEPTLIFDWGKVIFDIIDKSGDNAITLDEWEHYQRAAQVVDTIEDCKATFDVCDQDGDGKIRLEELTRQHIGFWYTGEVDGLYGPGIP
jgi:Ca2+-binding EF-hand superfamily protein